MFENIKKIILSKKINKIAMSDMAAAMEFMTISKNLFRSLDDPILYIFYYSKGLMTAAAIISQQENILIDDIFSGLNFGKSHPDELSRKCLEMAKVDWLMKGKEILSAQEKLEVDSIKFGFLLFYHIYRIRFILSAFNDKRRGAVDLCLRSLTSYANRIRMVANREVNPEYLLR